MSEIVPDRFIRQAIGCNVSTLRRGADISQAVFARMIHVNRPYYNGIELGRRNVSLDMLAKIADGLDVPITILLEGLPEEAMGLQKAAQPPEEIA